MHWKLTFGKVSFSNRVIFYFFCYIHQWVNNKKKGQERPAEKIGTERGIQMGVIIFRISDRFYRDSKETVLLDASSLFHGHNLNAILASPWLFPQMERLIDYMKQDEQNPPMLLGTSFWCPATAITWECDPCFPATFLLPAPQDQAHLGPPHLLLLSPNFSYSTHQMGFKYRSVFNKCIWESET